MNETVASKSVGRRAFFSWLAGTESGEGSLRPQFRLGDLPVLPPSDLAAIVPGVMPGVEITSLDEFVVARFPGRAKAVALFSFASKELAVFNRFNGSDSLAEVGAALCAESNEPPEAVFAGIRTLFLRLVCLGVCVPVNAPLPASPPPEPDDESKT